MLRANRDPDPDGPEAELPTRYGDFRIRAYPALSAAAPPVALVRDGDDRGRVPLVRVHSECLTGDALASLRCDCGPQLRKALRRLGQERRAALVYLRQEGRGIGLGAKVQAYALQDRGLDTYDANLSLGFAPDARSYEDAAAILRDLGMPTIRLLTNNPDKVAGLTRHGIRVAEVVPLLTAANPHNRRYLECKRVRFGHRLPRRGSGSAVAGAPPAGEG